MDNLETLGILSIQDAGRRQKKTENNTQNPNQTHYQLTSHLQSNTLELDCRWLVSW